MKEKKTIDFVAAIIGAIIGLVFVNTVPLWSHLTHGVILDGWTNILWAANLSMAVQIIGNLVLVIYRPARLYSLMQAIFAAVGLVSLIVFFNVFPLDFSQIVGSWLNLFFKFILLLAMIGTLIGTIVNLVRTIIGTQYTPATNK